MESTDTELKTRLPRKTLLGPRYKNYSLSEFVIEGLVEGVELLLSQGLDVNYKSNKYSLNFPIHVAAEVGHSVILKLLINAGADVNLRDDYSLTPLHYAKDLDTLKILLQAGADLHKKNVAGLTVLHSAIRNNKLPIIKFLISTCGLNVGAIAYDIRTPLHFACSLEICREAGLNPESVKFLLKNNADANSLDSFGHTPIQCLSSYEGNYNRIENLFKFLLKYSDSNAGKYSRFHHKKLCKIYLQHVAVLLSVGVTINSHHYLINNISEYKDYFEECTNELTLARSTKVHRGSWVTFYDLLTATKKSLKNFAGNQDLMNHLKGNDFSNEFPIYEAQVLEKVDKGIKRRQLYDKSCVLLGYCVPVFHSTHLVVRDVLDCARTKDLEIFVKARGNENVILYE